MTFNWSGRRFTHQAFNEWIRQQPRYGWIKGVTLHHTGVPTLEQWRGQRSVDGARGWYEFNKRWTGGPHLFFASDTIAKGMYDGVWIGNPLDLRGVHAGACNSTHLGLEVAGNYNNAPWSDKLKADLFVTLDAIFDWLGLQVNAYTLKGHRECMTPRDCPGWYVNLDSVRTELQVMRSAQPAFYEYEVLWPGSRCRKSPYTNVSVTRVLNATQVVRVLRNDVIGGEVTLRGITSDKWAQLIEGDYIWSPLIAKVD